MLCGRCYDIVVVYHNGAESNYAARRFITMDGECANMPNP
ncbi:hypothetical protein [Paenibacillus sp. TH7-28]